jgi:hypothetical protein
VSARGIALAVALGALAGCAAPGPAPRAEEPAASIPFCGPLESLPPLPDSSACGDRELAKFEAVLWERIAKVAGRALVRVELDESARVRALCVGEGPGYAPGSARRTLAEHEDEILAVPPGPACAAGKRIDMNRYAAKLDQINERKARCGEQTRVTRETQGPTTTVRDRTVRGAYGVYDRELERCMDYQADWIELDAPGSTLPAIWVKPEIPNAPGPDAYDTASRCTRLSHVFEKRAACIEADGWERLEPPQH